jgi:hypothetical protein
MEGKMTEYRKASLLIGVLYISGTVLGILSVVFTGPMGNSPEYCTQIASKENQYILGTVCILCMGFSLAFIPIILYPVLQKQSKPLALSYVIFRGALETVTYIATFVCMLLLLEIGKKINELENMSILLFKLRELTTLTTTYVFSIGAFIFYFILYQSKLIPHWLSLWGIGAILLHFATGLLIMFGLQTVMTPINFMMNFPIFLQEMVMAIWFIIKGLDFEKMKMMGDAHGKSMD